MKYILKLTGLFILFLFTNCKSNLVNNKITRNEKSKDSLAFLLCQIYGSDQSVRDSNLKVKNYKMIQEIDSINFIKIAAFVKKNGYPTKNILGTENINQECVEGAACSVLLHNPQRLVNEIEYYQLFLGEVKKGNLKPESLALILDKYYWTRSKNKKKRRVFYGSDFGKPCIQTKEATNRARIEIGLQILNDNEFVDCTGEDLDMPKNRD
jgi:hypothetical protein